MIKKIFIGLVAVTLLLMVAVLAVRFMTGGAEDVWACEKGEWVKHGNPTAPMPLTTCEVIPPGN
jgi:hypothetical protein